MTTPKQKWPVPEVESRIIAEFTVDATLIERDLLRTHWIATCLLSFAPVFGWVALIATHSWSYPKRARLYAQSVRVGVTKDAVVVVKNPDLLRDHAAADVQVVLIRFSDMATVVTHAGSVWITTTGCLHVAVDGLVNPALFLSTLLAAMTGSPLSIQPELGVSLQAPGL
jgi:hypothetical protein